MSTHVLKSNFTRGSLTPLAHARQELDLYQQAANEILNWVVLRHGGVRRRSGSRYSGATKLSTSKAALYPFIYNSDQAYGLEFGHQYMRVWARSGRADGTADNELQSADSSTITADTSFVTYGQVTSGGSPFEVASPYTAADVGQLQFAAINDVAYIAHKKYQPRKLSRLAHNSWTIAPLVFQDGPYLPINDTGVSLTLSANPTTNALVTFTFSTGWGFVAGDIGRCMRWQIDGVWMWGVIETFTSASVVGVRVKNGMAGAPSTLVTYTYRFGAFSDAIGWPGSVEFFEGRLCWARTNKQPRGVFYSMSNFPETYSPSTTNGTVNDDHGGTFEIFAGRADEILWLQEAPRLQIGMAGAIRSIGSSNIDQVMTPRNVSQKLEVPTGAASIVPLQIGPSTVFAGRYAKLLNDMYYDYQVNSLVSPDLSVTAEHLFRSGIIGLAFQQSPDNILWTVQANGTLTGTTFDRYEKVLGFHSHDFSGDVESVCSLPGDGRDDLLMIIRRTIGGVTKRYVEFLEKPFQDMSKRDAFFVDAGVTYIGNPVGTVTGLSHLEGQTVDILSDGAVLPRAVVSGGQVTLPNGSTGSYIHIGLPIQNRVSLLRPAIQTNDGTTLGRRKRAPYIVAFVLETLGLSIGPKGGTLDALRLRSPGDPMGSSPPLFSGTQRVTIEDSWENDAQIEMSVLQPLPATVLAIEPGVDLEGSDQ